MRSLRVILYEVSNYMDCKTIVSIVLSIVVVLPLVIIGAICYYKLRAIQTSTDALETKAIDQYKRCIARYRHKRALTSKPKLREATPQDHQPMSKFEQESNDVQINIEDFLK